MTRTAPIATATPTTIQFRSWDGAIAGGPVTRPGYISATGPRVGTLTRRRGYGLGAPMSTKGVARTEGRWMFAAAVVLALLGAAGAAAIPSLAPSPVSCGSLRGPPTPPRTPIDHLFFLIKENHAFENYFGDLPGVIGYPPNGSFPTAYGSNATIAPFPIPGDATPDLPHDRPSLLADLDGGRDNDFVAQAAADGYPDPADSIGYYTQVQLPDYYAYARNYTLADDFFTGALGPTLPNRLFDLGLTNVSWATNAPPPASAVEGETILQQFEAAGIPWDYLYSGPSTGLTPLLVPQVASDPCLAARILPMSDLSDLLRDRAPPSLVVLDPSNDPLYSEHPPLNVTLGEDWSAAVLDEIFTSPIAASSAVLLWYDEGGGFWDPVVPPTQAPIGDGFRVPLLAISPWSGGGHVDATPLDPASLLAFADQDFGLPPLNARVAAAGSADLTLFNFSGPPRPPLLLPTPVNLAHPYPNGTPPPFPDLRPSLPSAAGRSAVRTGAGPGPLARGGEPWAISFEAAPSPRAREAEDPGRSGRYTYPSHPPHRGGSRDRRRAR